MPSGSSMVKTSERAMERGSTRTRGSKSGKSRGSVTMVTTIKSTIKPTPKATLPWASCASLGRNGAPADTPTRRHAEQDHADLERLAQRNHIGDGQREQRD